MTLPNDMPRRCGECGEKIFKRRNLNGSVSMPWRDFPIAYVTKDLELWTCENCGNYVITAGDAEKIDAAVEASIRDQTSQFIDIIKSKSGKSLEELSAIIGISPQYLSNIRNEKRTPSFHLWNLLKIIAICPKDLIQKMDPSLDIRKENLLLRA